MMSNRPIKLNIGPKVTEVTHKFLSALFCGTPNRAAQLTLESFRPLYRQTMAGLTGKFEREELYLLLDVMNGTWLEPGLAGQHLRANAEDGIDLNKLDEKWEVDKYLLIGKLSRLTPFELWCLEIWSVGFWTQLSQDLVEPDSAEKWVEHLLPEETADPPDGKP